MPQHLATDPLELRCADTLWVTMWVIHTQAIAPPMDGSGKPLRGQSREAHPCGRPAGVPIRLSSPEKPMEQ